MTGRVIVGFLWLTIVITAAGVWSGGIRHGHLSASPTTRTTAVLDDATFSDVVRADTAVEPRIDLYGNEVEDAVGDYRLDVRGDVYERHSPETEVTQLAAPCS